MRWIPTILNFVPFWTTLRITWKMRIFIIQETISVSNIFIQWPKIKVTVSSTPLNYYLLFIAVFLDDEKCIPTIRVFSRNVMSATLLFFNKGTAAMLASPINPPGIGQFRIVTAGLYPTWNDG